MKEGGGDGPAEGCLTLFSPPPPGWAHTAAKMEAGREREKGGWMTYGVLTSAKSEGVMVD